MNRKTVCLLCSILMTLVLIYFKSTEELAPFIALARFNSTQQSGNYKTFLPVVARSPIGIPPGDVDLSLVSHMGGVADDVDVEGNYAYVNFGPKIEIFDISTPSDLGLIGESPVLTDTVRGFDAVGDYVYITAGFQCLVVLNVRDKTNPIPVANKTDCLGEKIAVANQKAYIAASTSGLKIYDVTDPTKPTYLGGYQYPALNGSLIVDVEVIGNIAYLVDFWGDSAFGGSLYMVDISNPSQPSLVGTMLINDPVNSINVFGSTAYVGGIYTGLYIIDVSNPSSPQFISTYGGGTNHCEDAKVAGDTLFLTCTDFVSQTLSIVDIHDQSSPTLIKNWNIKSSKNASIYVENGIAFIAGDGLALVNVIDPVNPVLIDEYSSMSIAGGIYTNEFSYISTSKGLQIMSLANPDKPVSIGSYEVVGGVTNILLKDKLVFVGIEKSLLWYLPNSLVILDVSNPSTPLLAGQYDNQTALALIEISDTYLYATYSVWSNGFHNGLAIIDIHNIITPTLTSVFPMDIPMAVPAKNGQYIYAPTYDGLKIIDVSEPYSPTLVNSTPLNSEPTGINIEGKYAYLLTTGAIKIFDIRDIHAPDLVNTYSPNCYGGQFESQYIRDGVAFVASMGGVSISDISDPKNPVMRVCYPIPGNYTGVNSRNVSVIGDHIYLSKKVDGLFILKFTLP
jgi:hypothetical protein